MTNEEETSQTESRPLTPERLDAAYRNLERTVAWVNNADSKALIFLTFDGVVVGVLAANANAVVGTLSTPRPLVWQVVIDVTAACFIFAFSVSLLVLLRALFPDTNEREHPAGRGSLFFFGTIARLSDADFKQRWSTLDSVGIEQELLQQTTVNAAIVAVKFAHLKTSVRVLIVALASLLLLILSIVLSSIWHM